MTTFISPHFPCTALEVAEYDAFLAEINAEDERADREYADHMDRVEAMQEERDRWSVDPE